MGDYQALRAAPEAVPDSIPPGPLRHAGVGDGLLYGSPSLNFADGHTVHQSTAGSPRSPSCQGSACLEYSRVTRASMPEFAGPGGLITALLPNTDLTGSCGLKAQYSDALGLSRQLLQWLSLRDAPYQALLEPELRYYPRDLAS